MQRIAPRSEAMKDTLTFKLLVDEVEGGRYLLAPKVGRYVSPPPRGTWLEPGAPAGILRVLRKSYRLIVPANGKGVVRELLTSTLGTAVQYGQPLLALTLEVGSLSMGGPDATGAPQGVDEGIPEGMIAVRSPTDGIFYRRPGPDEPAYVAEGQTVERGKVLGLVEVMKCFNQIIYGDPSLPPKAKVTRIIPEDNAEVKLGQALFVLDPR